jgi:transposase
VRLIAQLTDEELNLEALNRTYSGRGSRPHRPDLLLKLMLYEHDQGRPQPVQWFSDLDENKPVQWLTFGMKLSLTTLYKFRDRAQPLLEELNRQVIRTAIDEGHTGGSCGSLDGSTVAANASRHRLVTLETVERRMGQLDQELAKAETVGDEQPATEMQSVEELPAAETVSSPTPQPSDAKGQSFLGKTARGKKRQRTAYRRAAAELREQHRVNAKRRKDKRKKEEQIRVAIGDPMAPLGIDKYNTFRPLYNVQTMSDIETDLVLAYTITRSPADSGQLVPMIDRTNNATGRTLLEVLADSGYPSGRDLAECKKRGVIVLAPWNENSFTEAKRAKAEGERQTPKSQFTFDPSIQGYRCPQGKVLSYRERTSKQRADGTYFPLDIYQADPSECAGCPQKTRCVTGKTGARTVGRQEHEAEIEELKERMKLPESKKRYAKRCCTIERRFADLKTHRGLQRFSGQTPERAEAQLGFAVLVHNLRTLNKLRLKKNEQQDAGKIAS